MLERERRVAQRVIKSLEVKYGNEAENIAITSNISETGMFIRTNNMIKTGKVLKIKLNLPDSKGFYFEGKVVRNRHSTPGFIGEAKNGIGIHLIDSPQNYIDYIRALLA
jgi:Tfp pilus assembly protein PilZ